MPNRLSSAIRRARAASRPRAARGIVDRKIGRRERRGERDVGQPETDAEPRDVKRHTAALGVRRRADLEQRVRVARQLVAVLAERRARVGVEAGLPPVARVVVLDLRERPRIHLPEERRTVSVGAEAGEDGAGHGDPQAGQGSEEEREPLRRRPHAGQGYV